MNKVQKIQFDLMKHASFNEFNGEKVVKDLIENEGIWRGAFMATIYGDNSIGGLIRLRDLPGGYWNVDTLYILPVMGKEVELKKLAKKWCADEVSWIGGEKASKLLGEYSREMKENQKTILMVWWD